MLKWRAQEYKKPRYIPGRSFLVEERARVLIQIRQTKWQIAWYAMTSIAGFIYLFWPTTRMQEDTLDFISGFLLGLLLVHFVALIDRILELRPALNRIEHDLKKFDTVID